jgi:hypothetical protein
VKEADRPVSGSFLRTIPTTSRVEVLEFLCIDAVGRDRSPPHPTARAGRRRRHRGASRLNQHSSVVVPACWLRSGLVLMLRARWACPNLYALSRRAVADGSRALGLSKLSTSEPTGRQRRAREQALPAVSRAATSDAVSRRQSANQAGSRRRGERRQHRHPQSTVSPRADRAGSR